MNKTLLLLLAATLFALAALPGTSRAASGDGDYTSLHVPDLPQAVDFFEHVMDCGLISASAPTDPAQTAVMDCGHGTVVEMIRARPAESRARTVRDAIALVTDDPKAAAAWLHARHVRLLGPPTTIARGADAGRTVVTVLAPWGQPLRLISPRAETPMDDATAGSRLAAE